MKESDIAVSVDEGRFLHEPGEVLVRPIGATLRGMFKDGTGQYGGAPAPLSNRELTRSSVRNTSRV